MRFIAVIGDVVASRAIADRRTFQRQFETAVSAINCRSQRVSPFTITLGDEVQALYSDGTSLFRDLWFLAAALQPQRIRFALGIGDLTTPVNPCSAIGMDGPAFHRARDGINLLKEQNHLLTIVGSDTDDFAVENGALQILSHLCQSWRQTRWCVLQGLVSDEPISRITNRLRLSPTAVYKNIHAGSLDVVISLSDSIGARLTRSVRGH